MLKKQLRLALFLATALLTVGCGQKEKKEETVSEDKGSVTAWAWDPNFNIEALKIAEDIYQEDNPDFTLTIVENAQDDIIQKLNTSLSSGTLKGLPNLVLIEDYRAQSFIESYPDSFMPLTDYFNAEDFMDYKVEATSIDNVNYGLPFDTGVTGLYVRKDIIEEAGFTLDDLTNITWEEYAEIGKEVFKKTGVQWFSNDMNDLGIMRTMIQASGRWYSTPDGTAADFATNEALKLGFENFKDMFDAGIVATHSDWSGGLQSFNDGKVATITSGNWMTPSVKAETSQSGDWSVLPYPKQSLPNSVNASNLGGSSFYVINKEGKEETAKFLEATFASNVELYQRFIEEIGAIGSYTKANEGAAYEKGDDYFGGQQIYKDFSNWAVEIPRVNFGKNTYALEDILKQAMQDYINGGDLTALLAKAQETANTQVK